MKLENLDTDNNPEIKLKTLKLIRQQESKEVMKLLPERSDNKKIFKSLKKIEKKYKKKRDNLYAKNCNKCSHKCSVSDYCNIKKAIIYNTELYAFSCEEYKKVNKI